MMFGYTSKLLFSALRRLIAQATMSSFRLDTCSGGGIAAQANIYYTSIPKSPTKKKKSIPKSQKIIVEKKMY